MHLKEKIDTLEKFKNVDKYKSFHEILPSVAQSCEEQKNIVSDILDNCSVELIGILRASKRPSKAELKKELIRCMDEISVAVINAENRDFGYQLGWYLADKVDVNLKKGTEKKIWGYWEVEGSEVHTPVKPRVSGKRKAQKKES